MFSDIMAPPELNKALFGRRWRITILVPKDENELSADVSKYIGYVVSDSDHEDTSLRVTFRIQNNGYEIPNFSEIVVYNMNPQTENLVIDAGTRVIVEAGYVNGAFGAIYDSSIFQALWEREDNTTTKVTFRCIDAMDIIYENHVSMVQSMKYQKDMVLAMAAQSRRPFTIKKISDEIENIELARGKVFFDSPVYYMRKYAQQSGTLPSTQSRDIYLMRPQDQVPKSITNQALVLSPGEGGLIGTPQQTQEGITFVCLLNPQLMVFKPEPMMVKIDNKIIRQLAVQYNSAGFSRLDEDGVYKILGVTHIGDTRGNEWYTQVVGCNQSMEGTLPAMFSQLNSDGQG